MATIDKRSAPAGKGTQTARQAAISLILATMVAGLTGCVGARGGPNEQDVTGLSDAYGPGATVLSGGIIQRTSAPLRR